MSQHIIYNKLASGIIRKLKEKKGSTNSKILENFPLQFTNTLEQENKIPFYSKFFINS